MVERSARALADNASPRQRALTERARGLLADPDDAEREHRTPRPRRPSGARPWTERARAGARAAGLDITDSTSDVLVELSPQRQRIIRLAARGLTNREIGENFFLSPRTVGSHLCRSFPELGITVRSQPRDLVEGILATAAHRS